MRWLFELPDWMRAQFAAGLASGGATTTPAPRSAATPAPRALKQAGTTRDAIDFVAELLASLGFRTEISDLVRRRAQQRRGRLPPVLDAIHKTDFWSQRRMVHWHATSSARSARGKHYVDLFAGDDGFVRVGVHFGLRGLGAQLRLPRTRRGSPVRRARARLRDGRAAGAAARRLRAPDVLWRGLLGQPTQSMTVLAVGTVRIPTPVGPCRASRRRRSASSRHG